MGILKEIEEFNEKLKSDFIPAIEKMIEKEEAHIAFLKQKEKEYWEQRKKWYGFFTFCSEELNFSEMIEASEEYLGHYRQRLKEYQNYARTSK